MAFPTQPAFVIDHTGWKADSPHPMVRFVYDHTVLLDSHRFGEGDALYDLNKYKLIKSTGEAFTGKTALEQVAAQFALFAENFHEPEFAIVHETATGGYRFFGSAKLFANLVVPGGDKKFEDSRGRKWQVCGRGAFLIDAEKDASSPSGLLFTFTQIFSDPTEIVKEAIKVGAIPVEALLGA